jgi:hypothetical protein
MKFSAKNYHLIILLFFLVTISSGNPVSSQQLRKIENNAFQKGEKISYRVFYDSYLTGNVNAGVASLEIKPESEIIGGRKTMNVVGLGRTRGAFNFFFRVVNRYETYIDEEAIIPLLFIRRINEGGYKKSQDVMFNQRENLAISNTATVKVAENIQDLVSAFYYMRTFDYTNARVGDVYDVSFFLDDTVYVSRVMFDGREEITTRSGTFKTLRFKPQVLTGEVFSQPYPMTLWISDDKNKIPILAQSGIIVGSVKMELVDYKGLRNPLTSRIR